MIPWYFNPSFTPPSKDRFPICNPSRLNSVVNPALSKTRLEAGVTVNLPSPVKSPLNVKVLEPIANLESTSAKVKLPSTVRSPPSVKVLPLLTVKSPVKAIVPVVLEKLTSNPTATFSV